MFVCLEGIDASGKATHSRRLAERLKAKLFSFPDYNTPMGHLIKGHLLRYWRAEPADTVPANAKPEAVDILNAKVFQALQLANRMEHAQEINDLVSTGHNVVTDRYWPSGFVYGAADGLDGQYIMETQRFLPQPDLFILMDIDPEDSILRRPERRDRYETQAGLMEQVAGLYRELWQVSAPLHALGKRWVVVDARGTQEETAAKVWEAVTGLKE